MKVLRALTLLAGAALALPACQTDAPAPVTSVTATPVVSAVAARQLTETIEFRCPTAGTAVTYDTGGTVRHLGPSPNDPMHCRFQNGAVTGETLMTIWSRPIENEEQLKAGFAALWPLQAGKTASFVFVGRTRDGATFQFQETWRVVGADRLRVGETEREAIVIQRTQEGRLGNTHLSNRTFWIDRDTRAILRERATVIRGISNNPERSAVRIVAAGPS